MINRRFAVIKKLGQGRSEIFLCKDLDFENRDIAFKVLPAGSSKEEKEIFKREFETMLKLDHPNIIRAYEFGTIIELSENESFQIGSQYLAMEYFEGKILLDYDIESDAELNIIIAQICSALFYLHQSKYIYYDLKPENILVNKFEGKTLIKLIDLGFARTNTENLTGKIAGTAEYLAPEILKNEAYDHRIDFYALGIMLYRLIYQKFPFSTSNQLEIYKEHIAANFDFPPSSYSVQLINVIKKLVNNNPNDRYFSAVQILYDLNIPITEDLSRNWGPVKVFSNRIDILNIINRYIRVESSGEIIIIRGFEGSGKSSIISELNSRYPNSIKVANDRRKSGYNFVKFFLKKIIFNEIVFPNLTADLILIVNRILSNDSKNLTEDLRLIISKISNSTRFILLIDDFNLFDNFSLEIFKEIFPILQINGCNVIITEKSDLEFTSGFLSNFVELTLGPFTTDQTEELLEQTYADFLPLDKIKQLIRQYADFLPGNIVGFLKDIVLLNIIQFQYDGIKVVLDDNSEEVLNNLFQEIYNIRCKSLTKEELGVSELLASFDTYPEKKHLLQLLNINESKLDDLINQLQQKNILHPQSSAIFTSEGIKNFIYSQIPEKKTHHSLLAQKIREIIPGFNRVELSRHYQICEKYNECYTLLMTEADDAEKIGALKYQKNILEQLLKLPLESGKNQEVKYQLCSLNHSLNIYKSAHDLSEELLQIEFDEDKKNSLLIIKGNSLIRMGKIEAGKEILKELLPYIKDETKKLKIMLDIAWGELELNNFEAAEKICKEVLSNPLNQSEFRGDCYNLLGSIDYYQKNDFHSALSNFEKSLQEYVAVNLSQRIAGVEINMGNIYNILGEHSKLKNHWEHSLKISSSLGNLYYQGQVLMNFGVHYFDTLSFNDSIKNYKRAALIFNSIGDKSSFSRCEINLGELYLFICEYQNAIDSLKSAHSTIRQIGNTTEESETLFLMGKTYARMGDVNQLNKIIEGLINLEGSAINTERVKLHSEFLKCIIKLELNQKIETDKLRQIAAEYFLKEERINFFESITLLVYYYLNQGEALRASELLSDKDFTETCKSNIYLEAEKLYLMGKAASENSESNPESSIFFFNEAFNLISDLNINEITCKVILELSNYFYLRGNLLKAKEYATYGRSLIYYMADQFELDSLKNIYLNSSYRKSAQEKFTEIIESD